MSFVVITGDSREVLPTMAADSFDSIVTDPPYELGFMGKSWDSTGIAYDVGLWREALRVLKPGGHLLAFSGSRTYHRMVCAIEDAGFEIRDQIMWVYSTGFPKSHNLDNHRGKTICGCESATECDVRSVHDTDVSTPIDVGAQFGKVLQPSVPQQGASVAGRAQPADAEDRCSESGLEGRRDDFQEARKLQGRPLRASASVGAADGAQGRLHHGAPAGDGRVVREAADTNGDGASHRSSADEQPAQQPRTVAGQPQPQAGGAWPVCGGCGKPVLPKGLGTALKPAHEPIVVARKPLIGTVAANVLAHGTGAINIDGCRVNSGPVEIHQRTANVTAASSMAGVSTGSTGTGEFNAGRWPANLIHDGSDEVVALFPAEAGAQAPVTVRNGDKFRGTYGAFAGNVDEAGSTFQGDTGSAARFFYCAKATAEDRHEGCHDLPDQPFGAGNQAQAEIRRGNLEFAGKSGTNTVSMRKNNHPTVKPTDLMRYLCRLVTPKGGHVLDLFAGSGSTGRGAVLEGFDFTGIELGAAHAEIARARIDSARRQGHQPSLLDAA